MPVPTCMLDPRKIPNWVQLWLVDHHHSPFLQRLLILWDGLFPAYWLLSLLLTHEGSMVLCVCISSQHCWILCSCILWQIGGTYHKFVCVCVSSQLCNNSLKEAILAILLYCKTFPRHFLKKFSCISRSLKYLKILIHTSRNYITQVLISTKYTFSVRSFGLVTSKTFFHFIKQ